MVHILDAETGHALSAEHQRIAEIIKDYDETLELAWIPPNARAHNEEFPFAVIHKPLDAPEYVVFKLKESEVDHRVLARLFAGDSTRHSNILDVIENEEAARRIVEMKRDMDAAEEARELAAWAVKARPGAKHNGVRFE